MSQFFKQFQTLVWKNALLKMRNPIGLLIEFCIPIAVIIGLWGIRQVIKPKVIDESIPSTFKYSQSLSELYSYPSCGSDTLFWRCVDASGDVCDIGNSKCQLKHIAIAPRDAGDAEQSQAAMDYLAYVNANFDASPIEPLFVYFESEDAFTDYITSSDYSIDTSLPIYSAGIIFNQGYPNWDYTIRLNKTQALPDDDTQSNPETDVSAVDNKVKTNDELPEDSQGRELYAPYLEAYLDTGIYAIQDSVNSYVATKTCQLTNSCDAGLGQGVVLRALGYVDFPSPEELTSLFWSLIGPYFALLMILALLYPFANVIRALVAEKESRMREGMLMMSLRSDVLWVSWIFHFLLIFIPLAVALMIAGTLIFIYSEMKYIFLYFFAFFLASLSYAILVSVLFSKAKTASIVGTIIFFMGYFVFIGLETASPSRSQLLLACLHPASAFTYGTLAFTEYEDSKVGLNDDTWTESSDYLISFRDTIVMQFVNMAYLLVLAWYFSQVWPSEYGTSKPWYFIFQSNYWLDSLSPILNLLPIQLHSRLRTTSANGEIEMEAISSNNEAVEGITEDLKEQIENNRCVDIRNLRKEFMTNSGKKVAVDGLSLQMFTGQITALLGHNGAGKTTTLSMLTGLIPPDSGTAYINGINIRENMDEARKSLGVCPQHDVLLDDLTVEEHLSFFASIKGTTADEIEAEVSKYIDAVGLPEKRKDYVKNLSGGQKRKLSVAIAFIGNSKVVILDEPTSGMDPYSRRFTWNVIRQHRENRIVILTTHFMDEADLLGDRIAIMGDGRLCCCGTSLFLKKMYGVGYNMTIEKASATSFDESTVLTMIRSQIPDAKLLTNVGTELTVQLPLASSNQFVPLFQKMDDNLESLKIQSYGMSVTTLEEVFLKVASGSHDYLATTNEKDARNQGIQVSPSSQQQNPRKVSAEQIEKASEVVPITVNPQLGVEKDLRDLESRKMIVDVEKIPEQYQLTLFFQHMRALLRKRYIIFSRDTKTWVYQFLLPVIFLLAGVAIMYVAVFSVKQPEKILTIDDYNPNLQNNVLPLPFSAANAYCDLNNTCVSINGQEELMSYAANAENLPLEPGTDLYSIEDVSEYIFENRKDQYSSSRYGAYTFSKIESNNLDGNLSSVEYFVHANYTGVHAGPTFTSFMGDVVVRYFNPEASVTTRLHPLPDTKLQDKLFRNFNLTNLIFFVLLAIPFIPASFGGYVVYEKETRTKAQQIVSGVSLPAYWLANWLWDFCTYQITCWLIIIIIVSFPDTEKISKGKALGATIVLFQLYGLSVSGFSYLMAFFMKKASTAQITILFSIFILGLILTIVGIVLRMIGSVHDPFMNYIRYFFCIFPPYALGDGLNNLALIDFWGIYDSRTYKPFDWDITGLPIMMMAIEAVAYIAFTILGDFLMGERFVQELFSGNPTFPPEASIDSNKDEDVLAEERRVQSDDVIRQSTILLRGVKKLYNTQKFAVKGISLGIPNGECFGLLGTNGAGKTSLLSMLVGNIFPSAGSIFLNGMNFADNTYSCRRQVGFCPQFDALFELMTAREHVTFYAEIKGLKASCLESEVNAKIAEMGLTQYVDRESGGYSGGNKRKLSVAIAMVGEPSLVFLDEPSTGMDPMARRFMWDVIVDIVTKREKCSLILTTHSMEECEALCSRIGIMVSGNLRCLGSGQRLRDRYGLGYQMEVLLEFPEQEEITKMSQDILQAGGFTSDVTSINEEALKRILENLGKSNWIERITPAESGADIRAALEINKVVTVKHLASWLVIESRSEAYFHFLETNFAGYQCRERQGAKIRIEVPFVMADGTRRKLSYMFGQMEASKKKLAIREYSIAQTSLEQIFNSFASQYDAQGNPGHMNSH